MAGSRVKRHPKNKRVGSVLDLRTGTLLCYRYDSQSHTDTDNQATALIDLIRIRLPNSGM